MSKKHSSDRRNYVPEINPHQIGIIGGKGAMGQLLARELEKDGYEIDVSGFDDQNGMTGRNLANRNRELISHSDVVFFSLPISTIRAGLDKVLHTGNFRGWRDKLFVDISSVKTEPMQSLQRSSAAVIGIHPMFGPQIKNMQGQNVVFCSDNADPRTEAWDEWLVDFWRRREANIIRMTPEEHDQLVPAVQMATLTAASVYGAILNAMEVDIRRASQIATPNSRLMHALIGRMLDPGKSGLYANLATENSHNVSVAESAATAARQIFELVKNGNIDGMHQFLQQISNGLPNEFLQEGSALAGFLQEAIAKESDVRKLLSSQSAAK